MARCVRAPAAGAASSGSVWGAGAGAPTCARRRSRVRRRAAGRCGAPPARVRGRSVGQQDLAPGQRAQQLGQAAFGAYHGAQVVEAVGLGKEIVGIDAVMAHHAEDGGAVAAPVVDADPAGGGLVGAEHARHVGRHQTVDLREDRVRSVVEGVVEVEQPDRLPPRQAGRRNLSRPGAPGMARPGRPGRARQCERSSCRTPVRSGFPAAANARCGHR